MRVSIVSDNPEDNGANWRMVSPWGALRREMGLDVRFIRGLWSEVSFSDWVIMHRPFSDNHVKIAAAARLAGCRLWCDWDDNLWDVPDYNPASKHYRSEHIHDNLRRLAEMSTGVTVATPYLEGLWRDHAAEIRVIPNALPDSLVPRDARSRCRGVFWRGTESHRVDLVWSSPWVAELPLMGCPVTCMGYNPCAEWLRVKYEYKGDLPFHSYMAALREMGHLVQIVPLVDTPFNRAKSNIAWMEGMTAGSVVVAPDWDEWRMPGVVSYGPGKSLSDAVREVLEMTQEESGAVAQAGLDYVQDHLILSKVNRLREDLVYD